MLLPSSGRSPAFKYLLGNASFMFIDLVTLCYGVRHDVLSINVERLVVLNNHHGDIAFWNYRKLRMIHVLVCANSPMNVPCVLVDGSSTGYAPIVGFYRGLLYDMYASTDCVLRGA